MSVIYAREDNLSLDDFVAVLNASGLGERRPMNDTDRLRKMLDGADLIVTARSETGTILGVARSITDFAYCLYCSDLAVDCAAQGLGIGKALLAKVCELTPDVAARILISAPAAISFYEHAGFQRQPNTFYLDRFTP